ncbi:MAG: 4-(cytidine 5'-diphospho)-2-C-methyl-D-erythritol kinase [Rickettsiales bacterium]|nr:4-(cytidine 5'-diphospho)-2-C-methyl-D-erythritol kinase [Rickettsiales bacterium]
MKQKSYAKINLFLKLTGKRADGFHELESLFAFLDLADALEVISSDKFDFIIDGEFATELDPQQNIITKILDFFVDNFKISHNLKIHLTKNIPVGAGLGGGSSNAAYFMKALNNIFSLKLTKEELQKISLQFGSDIAFFFEDKASIVRGRGDIIENYNNFNEISALLINPKINLSTKEVFAKFDNHFSTKILAQELQKKEVFDLINNFSNDLTKPAITILPAIADILNQLKNQQAKIAKMSGSGASCFAIFADQNQLNLAEQNLSKLFPNYFIRQVKILSCI